MSVNYSASGCSAASATSSNAITINARPVPTFLSAPGANICSATDITYTTQASQSSYSWSVPGTLGTDYTVTSGGTGTTNNTVTLKWITGGSKIVTVNYASSSCSGLNPASSTTTVTVRPIASFTIVPGANTCANTDVTYTTQAGQANYLWTVEGTSGTDYTITSGGVGITSSTVTLKWLTTGNNRTVTVNYTGAGSCTALVAATSTTFINSRPSPTFTTGPDLTTCANTDVTYSTQPGQSSYSWTVPGTAGIDYTISSGGIGASNSTVTLQWLTAGSKSVTINYNNTSGCNSLVAPSSNTTVNITVVPTISSGSSNTFCTGGSVTLSSTAGSSYQWYRDGAILTGATLNSFSANISGSYTVKVFNAQGCNATSAGTSVTVNSLPAINTSAQATSLCFSASSQISPLTYSDVDNGPTLYSITWDAAAASAGFSPVTNAALPSSPINISVPANAPGNTYTGTIIVTNANGCTSTPKNFTVKITSAPNVSNFSTSAAPGCVGTGATITINSSTLVNGTYTVFYDLSGANTATGNSASMIFSAGTGTFVATAINAGATNIIITQIALVGCSALPSSGNTASFTVNALPVIGVTNGANKVCKGSTITLTNTTAGGNWSSSDPSIATVDASGLVTGISAGPVDIVYTTAPNAANCTNSNIKNITVNPLPAIATITGTTVLCINTTTNLDDVTIGGSWASSNTSVASVNGSGVVSGLSAGGSTITYTITADANGCSNNTTATITVDPAATVNAGIGTGICQSPSPTAITLSGAAVGGAATSGAWSIVSGGGTLSSTLQTASPATITYTAASNYSGTVTLQLTTNAPGSCPAVASTKTITISQAPIVNAGITLNVCQSSSPSPITLSGATLGGGAATAAWSITAGGGTLSSLGQTATPETVSYTPAVNFSGTVTLSLITNAPGACSAAVATRTININGIPTVTAGGPNTVCKAASAITLAGASFGGGASSAAWSITSSGGGVLSSTAQTTSPAAVTYTPAATFTGTITLTLTSDATGGCTSAFATRSINITAPATVTPGGPDVACQSASPSTITLTGSSVGGGATTGAWSVISGGGALSTLSQTASPATITYTPAANYSGAVTLRLTTDIPVGCSAVSADRTINISLAPTATAGTPVITCANSAQTTSGSAAVNITAGSAASNNTSALWSSSGTGTFTNPTSLTTATYTPSSTDKSAGSVTLTLTAFGNSPCGNAISTKTFTITPAIDPTSSNNWTQVPTCSGAGVQFVLPAPPLGGNGTFSYQWMSKNNCGVAGVSSPVPGATGLTFIPQDGNCYWLFINSGGCAVPQSLVGGTNRQNPSPDTAALGNINFGIAGSADTICAGSSATLTAKSSVSYTYAWSPSTGLSSTTGATVTANPTVTTTYTVTATATSGPPCTKSATFKVTVNPVATLSSVAASSVCTGTNAVITLTGLLVNSTSTINYKIGSGSIQTVNAIVSNGSGIATFIVPVSYTDNGQTFTVTSIGSSINSGPSCTQNFSTSNSTVLNVYPTTLGGTLPSVSACTGSTGTLTLTGNVGNVVQWESSVNGGSTWSVISNTTTTNSYATASQNILYRVLVQSGSCNAVYSNIDTVGIHNLWAGTVSSDWQNKANWADGLLPSVSCPDVIIPAGTSFSPILGSGSATIINLTINSLATLTVTGATLQIAGGITNNGTFDVSNGSLDFNGTSSVQNIAGNMFVSNSLKNLTVSNTTGLNVSNLAGNLLNITGTITFGNINNSTINTGDNIVLVSNATGTARVADITNNNPANTGNKFVGKVIVERYFPARRSWRLLTSPLSNTGNIFNSWQNSAPSTYLPGKGMFVTGNNPTGSTGNGLDLSGQNNYSMKGWDPNTGSYINIGNTITQALSSNATNAANIGYYTFVRGDRNRSPDNTIFGNTNNTTLRSSGFLQTGTQTFNITSPVGSFPLIGNPYASSVDFTKITKVNVNPLRFYVYDASLGQLGLFVTMEDIGNTGTFTPSTPSTSIQTNHIQSSQAFFVEVTGSGAAVIFDENNKSTDYNPALFRPVTPVAQQPAIRINLLQSNADSSTLLVDASLVQFDGSYNNAVDIQDALKFTNIFENLALVRDNKYLAVERRPLIKENDSLFLRITKMAKRNYRFNLVFDKFTGDIPAGFLVDQWLNKLTPLNLNGVTQIDFAITTDSASAASDRFLIVFKPNASFANIKADVINKDINVQWDLENEYNTKGYEIERSTDGASFNKIGSRASSGLNQNTISYNWLDVSPVPGFYYYRIRSISNNGVTKYSAIVKVKINKSTPAVYVFPNPITEGTINLQMNDMSQGVYNLKLLNNLGQTVLNKVVNHVGGTSVETVSPGYKLAAGIYQLEIAAPGNKIWEIKVIVK